EHTLKDVITKIEPELFLTVTGLTVADFELLVSLKVFNTEQMNAAVFAFRRYEDASLRYTGIGSHDDLTHIGGFDTVVAVEQPASVLVASGPNAVPLDLVQETAAVPAVVQSPERLPPVIVPELEKVARLPAAGAP